MSSPRIIAGSARGLRLKSLSGQKTRPITDRVKESLFNIIRNDLPDSIFLDLFGGIGSVGIEALSRGAKFCQFVEKNPEAVRIIKENLIFTKLEEKANVHLGDAFHFLRDSHEIFDFVYIAPPQYAGLWETAIVQVDSITKSLISESGQVIVQIDPIEEKPIELENLILVDRRKYGSTLLLFFERVTII